MTSAVGKVWREKKHILIQAKFSRINGNNKYISQSTRNWKFGQHKSGLTKLLKATNRGFSFPKLVKSPSFFHFARSRYKFSSIILQAFVEKDAIFSGSHRIGITGKSDTLKFLSFTVSSFKLVLTL